MLIDANVYVCICSGVFRLDLVEVSTTHTHTYAHSYIQNKGDERNTKKTRFQQRKNSIQLWFVIKTKLFTIKQAFRIEKD